LISYALEFDPYFFFQRKNYAEFFMTKYRIILKERPRSGLRTLTKSKKSEPYP
jgi:hypothetical protein